MALRNIIKDGDPALHKKSREVVKFDDRLHILLDDMIETMRDANGVGLAAVQVGVLRRVIIVEVEEDELYEIVNPEIIDSSEEEQCGPEGCLSYPGEQAIVIRPKRVTIKGQDRHGNPVEFQGEDYLARAFLHETDHVNGIVFLDNAATDEELAEWDDIFDDLDDDDDDTEEITAT